MKVNAETGKIMKKEIEREDDQKSEGVLNSPNNEGLRRFHTKESNAPNIFYFP